MANLERLGLGCMGMSNRRNPENSIKTIHTALDAGITLFNTGEFYNAGESEMANEKVQSCYIIHGAAGLYSYVFIKIF